ncbi:hypothetical protein ACFPM0_30850 [Pseudonocardia sulfidoxydans]|uniref:hypothetical protein n=1 Tax=Pseudonocardia sulfidoxydans TaxID=54011 RepID=UPI0036104FEC
MYRPQPLWAEGGPRRSSMTMAVAMTTAPRVSTSRSRQFRQARAMPERRRRLPPC